MTENGHADGGRELVMDETTEIGHTRRFVRESNMNGSHLHDDDNRSLADIIKDITTHTQQLVRGEVDLIKTELTDNAKKAGVYAGMGAAAAVLGLVGLVFLGHTIAQALNAVMPAWAAFLITTVLFFGIAAVLGLKAKKGFAKTSLAPTESVEHAKEDVQWVKTHK